MADQKETVHMGPDGAEAFEALQKVYEDRNLTAKDGVCAAADFLIWVMMASFIRKEDATAQLTDMLPGMVQGIEANWDALDARRQVLLALTAGESGGRLQ